MEELVEREEVDQEETEQVVPEEQVVQLVLFLLEVLSVTVH